MFKGSVCATAFSSNEANVYFKDKIIGEYYSADATFLSTMRAVLSGRIGEDSITLSFRVMSATGEFSIPSLSSNTLIIYNVMANKDRVEMAFEDIDNYFRDFPGFERQDKITKFFSVSFHASNYIDRENKISILFVENLSYASMHYIQRVLLAILPWYFDKETGLTDDEVELFNSLTQKTPDAYLAICEKMANKLDFRSAYLKNKLGDFAKNVLIGERNLVINNISSLRNVVKNYTEEIQVKLSEINDLGIRLIGLDESIRCGNEDDEILNYFICNKSLSLLSTVGSTIKFCVSDYLTFYDEDMAENTIRNHNSYVYSECPRDVKESDLERLAKAIFIDQTLRVRFFASYELNINGSVRSVNGECPDLVRNTHMENPHIGHHNCLGNYEGIIYQALNDGDLLTAIGQCSASAKSLNFADGIVLREFFEDLYTGVKCIELPDGSVVGFMDAIRFLIGEES